MIADLSRFVTVQTYQRLYKKKFGKPISRQAVYDKIKNQKIDSVCVDGKLFVVISSDGSI